MAIPFIRLFRHRVIRCGKRAVPAGANDFACIASDGGHAPLLDV
jgi:hypothetical protein